MVVTELADGETGDGVSFSFEIAPAYPTCVLTGTSADGSWAATLQGRLDESHDWLALGDVDQTTPLVADVLVLPLMRISVSSGAVTAAVGTYGDTYSPDAEGDAPNKAGPAEEPGGWVAGTGGS